MREKIQFNDCNYATAALFKKMENWYKFGVELKQ